MLIGLPLLLLVIFGYAANFYVDSVKTVVVGPQATRSRPSLPSFFDVTVVEPSDGQPGRRRAAARQHRRRRARDRQTPTWRSSTARNLFAAQSTVRG